MKIVELSLCPFGVFENACLRFGDEVGLHIIYGDNEAGKSTTLRALRGLFFGIPLRSPDVHRFEGKKLRIEATLLGRDGNAVSVVRRKARKNDLLDGSGDPLDPAVLSGWFSGMEESYFNRMYALDQRDLVDGGEALLEIGGNVAQTIFGAGMAGGMRSLVRELGGEASALFTPRGKNPPLNAALAEYRRAKQELKVASLRPKEWAEISEEHSLAMKQQAGLIESRASCRLRETTLRRLARVVPWLVRRAGLRAELAQYDSVARLAETAAEDRRVADEGLERTQAEIRDLHREQETCEVALAANDIPEGVLEHEEQIEALAQELGEYRKALRDLPDRRSRVETLRADLRIDLLRLGKAAGDVDVDALLVSDRLRAKITALANQRGGIDAALSSARDAESKSELRIKELDEQRRTLPTLVDVPALSAAVARVHEAGDLEGQLRDLELKLATQDEAIAAGIEALPRWQGTEHDLRRLPVPSRDAVDAHRGALQESSGVVRDLERDLAQLMTKRGEVERDISALTASGEVATYQRLHDIRAERDECWQQIERRWLHSAEDANIAPDKLAERFESLVRSSDGLADRLRDDAKRSGQLVALESEKSRIDDECRRRRSVKEEADDAARKAYREWELLWKPCGIEPGTPEEMRGWLHAHSSLLDSAERKSDAEQDRERCAASIEANRRRVCAALVEATGDSSYSEFGFSLAVERARLLCKDAETAQRRHESWQQSYDDAVAVRRQAEAEMPARLEAKQRWEASWSESVSDIGLDGDATVEEAQAVLNRLGQIAEVWRRIEDLQRRIGHIEDDVSGFDGKASALAAACSLEGIDGDAAELVTTLMARLKVAREGVNRRTHHEQALKTLESKIEHLKSREQTYRFAIEALMSQAGVEKDDELDAAIVACVRRRELESKLEQIEENFRGESVSIDRLEREAEGVDADSLPGAIDEVCRELEELDGRIAEHQARVATLDNRLRALDGSSVAADAAGVAEEKLAEIRHLVSEYASLRIAERIVSAEMERYRLANQGPLLERASGMFARLTCGGFGGLSTDYDDNDEPVLVCVRPDGATVAIQALSEGTRDQLYLSLRLASLERLEASNEPIPLIMDDLFVNFDDARSRAAFELLLEISKTTQVLFFSHHRHLVEIAESCLPAERWKSHQLVDG